MKISKKTAKAVSQATAAFISKKQALANSKQSATPVAVKGKVKSKAKVVSKEKAWYRDSLVGESVKRAALWGARGDDLSHSEKDSIKIGSIVKTAKGFCLALISVEGCIAREIVKFKANCLVSWYDTEYKAMALKLSNGTFKNYCVMADATAGGYRSMELEHASYNANSIIGGSGKLAGRSVRVNFVRWI